MDETYSYQAPKPKAAPAPVDQKALLKAVVQKSIQLSQSKQNERETRQEEKAAVVDMKSPATERKSEPVKQAPAAKSEDDTFSKAQDLFQAK